MDKKFMEQIATELQTCGKALTALAEQLAQMGETSEVPTTNQPEVTLEEVRTVLAGLSRNGLTAKVRELLHKHGADRLSEVNPAEYAAILKEAESIGS